MAIDFNGINSGQVNPQRNARNEPASTEKTPATPTPQQQAQAATPAAREKVSLSSRAKDLKQAEEKLRDHPEVDDSHVQAIKTALENGQFKVDARKLAQKMLEMDKSIFG
jgi:negative regulator of flagellin synthesis FlgM